MRNIAVAALALAMPLAVPAHAGGFAQGLSVGMKHGAIQQAQADLRPSAAEEPMGRKSQAGAETGPATAASRMSEQGKLDTNGPAASDRDKGRARAEDRAGARAAKQARRTGRKYKSTNLD